MENVASYDTELLHGKWKEIICYASSGCDFNVVLEEYVLISQRYKKRR